MDDSSSRRRFLAAMAAATATGLSGCGGNGSSTPTAADVDETPTPEPTPTEGSTPAATPTETPMGPGTPETTPQSTPTDTATATATPEPVELTDWPTFMYNDHNWGHNPDAVGPHEDVSVVWERDLESNQVNGSPALVDGTVYVGDGRRNTDSGTLYALDARTGETNWTFDLPGPVVGGVGVSEGRVYAGSTGTLAAYREDGSELYRFDTRSNGRISAPTFGDGAVFFGLQDTLYRVESLRNVREWTGDTFGVIPDAPVFDDGSVYAPSHDGSVYAYDAGNGNERWTNDLGSRVNGLSMRNGRMYAPTEDGRLVQLNDQGSRVWSMSHSAAVTATPAVTEEMVYLGTRDGDLVARSVSDGFEQWRFTEPSDPVTAPPVVADGTVYVGCKDNNVYAVDAESGAPEWRFETGNNIVDPAPVVSGGMVYIGSRDGTFYALG
ncbi:MAG: PQQ-binding-like beta-propeller repeat protein [Haloarculaceae archaeon]